MTNRLKFIWIDDDPGRKSAAENMENSLNVKVDFVDVRNKDLESAIKDLIKETEPDLIIIDHNLHDVKEAHIKAGSTAATIIREKWVDCPIICISGADDEYFNAQQREIYEAIFPVSDIAKHYQTIESIARSYKDFKNGPPENVEQLLSLLDVPEDETERLKSVIPNRIKDHLKDSGILKFLSVWIRFLLMSRPGFLYDRIWTATFIGIKDGSFSKVESLFESARYTGLFADPSRPRWWKSRVLTILGEHVDLFGLPWEKGARLPGLSLDDQSICYVTKEPLPETVAYLDEMHRRREPMKLKVTITDDASEDLLYFEELRKMAP